MTDGDTKTTRVMMKYETQRTIINEIVAERERQDAKWGEQNHEPFTWLAILGEEVGEANKAALHLTFSPFVTADSSNYRDELIQVAAVALAAVESFDRIMRTDIEFECPMDYELRREEEKQDEHRKRTDAEIRRYAQFKTVSAGCGADETDRHGIVAPDSVDEQGPTAE